MNHSRVFAAFCAVCLATTDLAVPVSGSEPEVPNIGNKLELFVDAHRIEKLNGVFLKLHSPKRMGTALKFDKPWEGLASAYVTGIASLYRSQDLSMDIAQLRYKLLSSATSVPIRPPGHAGAGLVRFG